MLVKGSMETAEKREDPRVKRTRELIVRAFGELVAEKGHRGLTVQEIAERATVNRATFYDHFRDQYELLDYFMSEAFREQLRGRLPESPGLDEESLRALVLATCDFLSGLETSCRTSDRQFRPLIEAQVASELYELLLGWIEASPHEANGRQAAPEITASVVSWAVFGAGVRWSRDGAAGSEERFADQVLSVIAGGLNL
ncbi:MAG: TetR/AcrR family transcriptional regulator [Actinomycetota bacterium]|nr:TetR/AcrR family transcriptional regulator [Actinomycetota bacterium]